MKTSWLLAGIAASLVVLSLIGVLPGMAQDVNQPGPPPASSGGWRKFPTDPSATQPAVDQAAADPSADPARDPQQPAPQSPGLQAPGSNYDKAIFQKPIPSDQLAFLKQFAGAASGDLVRDKQFRKLMHSVIPDCVFHYGWDMPLGDALDMVLKRSPLPVRIRDGRYLIVSGRSGPYLAGRGFIWIDFQDSIALGGFYFHPTNGEPTPTVNIFSKQVKEESLKLSQLPLAFAEDLSQWSAESRVLAITTRYFMTGSNRKILLEHDEDFCAPAAGIAPPNCQQMNADAADIDLDAAYYLEQTDHATNATAWMITGDDQTAWLQVRYNTCRVGPDPLGCRIRLTRERTHLIIRRRPLLPRPPRV
jgi:uncharacterized protein YecT (DUF1311 family)